MNRQISGTLYISPDTSNPERKVQYQLKEGENLIGTSADCQVILNLPNIPPYQCTIHIFKDTSATISAIDEEFPVLLSSSGASQILRPDVEYQLPSGLVFYLNNEYKCFIEVEEEELLEEAQSTVPLEEESGLNVTKRNESENNENNIRILEAVTQNDNEPEPVQITLMLSEYDESQRILKTQPIRTLGSSIEDVPNNVKTQSIENNQEEILLDEDPKIEVKSENDSMVVLTDKLSDSSSPRIPTGDDYLARDPGEEIQPTLKFSQDEDFYVFVGTRKNFTQQNTVEISQDDIKEEKIEEEHEAKNADRRYQRTPYVKEEELLQPAREISGGRMEEEIAQQRERSSNSNSHENVSNQPNRMETEEKEIIPTLIISDTSREQSPSKNSKNKNALQIYQENIMAKLEEGQDGEVNLNKEAEVENVAEFLQKEKLSRLNRINENIDKRDHEDYQDNKVSKKAEVNKEIMGEQKQIDQNRDSQEAVKFNRRKIFKILSSQTPRNSQAAPSKQTKESEKKTQKDTVKEKKKVVKRRNTKENRGKDASDANISSLGTKEELLTRMEEVSFKDKGQDSKRQSKQFVEEKKSKPTAQEKEQRQKNLQAQIQQICDLVNDEDQEVIIDYREKEKTKAKIIEIDSDINDDSSPSQKSGQNADQKPVYKKEFKKAHPHASYRIENIHITKKTVLNPEDKSKSTKINLSVEIEKPEEILSDSSKSGKSNEIGKSEELSKKSSESYENVDSYKSEVKSRGLSKNARNDLVVDIEIPADKFKQPSKKAKSDLSVELDKPEEKLSESSKSSKSNLTDKPEGKSRESSKRTKSYWEVEIENPTVKPKEASKTPRSNLSMENAENSKEFSKSKKNNMTMEVDKPEEKVKQYSKGMKKHMNVEIQRPYEELRELSKSIINTMIHKPEEKSRESLKSAKSYRDAEFHKPEPKAKEYSTIAKSNFSVAEDMQEKAREFFKGPKNTLIGKSEEKLKESSKSTKKNEMMEIEEPEEHEEIKKGATDSKKEASVMELKNSALPKKIIEIGKRYSPLRNFNREKGIKLSFQGPCKEEFIHYDDIFRTRKKIKDAEEVEVKTQRLKSASIETSKERKAKAGNTESREKGNKRNIQKKDFEEKKEVSTSDEGKKGRRKTKQEESSESGSSEEDDIEEEEEEEEEIVWTPSTKKYSSQKKGGSHVERDIEDILANKKGTLIGNLIKIKAGKPAMKKESNKELRMEVEESEESETDLLPKGGRKRKEKPLLDEFEKVTTVSKKFKNSEDTKAKIEEDSQSQGFTAIKRNSLQVAFTGFDKEDERLEKIQEGLTRLGVKIIEESNKNFNVLVIDKFKRTIKFLLAVNRGVHIVRYQWAKESVKHGGLLPFDDYAYVDTAAEARFKFKFAKTLEYARSGGKSFMDGYCVYIPANIRPSFEDIKLLVESADAYVMKTKPLKYREDLLILLNEDDKKNVKWAKELGFQPYSLEMIYSGVLNQRLDLSRHKL